MDPASYLTHLRHDFATFEACLRRGPTDPVEHCGRWTLYDLANHLGQGNMWAAVACDHDHGDHEGPAAPRNREALAVRVLFATPAASCSPRWTLTR